MADGSPTAAAAGGSPATRARRHHSQPVSAREAAHLATSSGEDLQGLLPNDIELVPLCAGDPSKSRSLPGALTTAEKFPERRTGARQTALVLVADIVGTGVLGLPGHMAKLGWTWGLLSITSCMVLNLYTGLLVGRLGAAHPSAVSYGDLGQILGGPRLASIAFVFVYVGILMTTGGYMLVLGHTFQGIFFETELCLPVASLVAAVMVWPIAQMRSFHELKWFITAGNATIIVVVAACMADIAVAGPVDDSGSALHKVAIEDISYGESLRSISAFTGIVFAYSGQAIFLEIMSEMKTPTNFHHALGGAATFLFCLYITISSLGYGFKGLHTPTFLPDVIPAGPLSRVSNLLMFVHMVTSYQIKLQGRLWWMLFTTSLLFTSWAIANAVPFFDDCVGVIGAATSSPSSFGFPAVFALLSWRRSSDTPHGLQLRRWEPLALACLCGLTVFLMIAGLFSNVQSILHHTSAHGGPFSCHCAAAPGVCRVPDTDHAGLSGGRR